MCDLAGPLGIAAVCKRSLNDSALESISMPKKVNHDVVLTRGTPSSVHTVSSICKFAWHWFEPGETKLKKLLTYWSTKSAPSFNAPLQCICHCLA